MKQIQIDQTTQRKLLNIGFNIEELKFFTPEQAQVTLDKFKEKLRRTKNWDRCSVKIKG